MIFVKDNSIIIRSMEESDILYFTNAFIQLGWSDRSQRLRQYFNQQNDLERIVLVAQNSQNPVAYLTIVPNAKIGPFANKQLPEIKDFNVLPKFRRQGIGNRLMECAENIAKENNKYITLAIGMYRDYGSAQRMYVKRGYIPDGSGLWHGEKNLDPYEKCCNDDDLNLYFIKQLQED